ncbi:MAG TPA: hypothetical protein VEC39_19955 [Vicinamibacterales bacterium]|nr:hypothetical protein [Vicinamibacterales bacterium]
MTSSFLPQSVPRSRAGVLLVAHDAGGAELVTSLARREGLSGEVCASGPAREICARKLPAWPASSLDAGVARCEWVLTGTSWSSDHEWRAIAAARAMAKPSVAFLDHWVCYRERFVRGEVVELPDELWVADEWALDKATREFPAARIALVGNPYLADQAEALERLPRRRRPDDPTVLFLGEPISDQAVQWHGNSQHYGYTEHEALEFFFEARASLGLGQHRVLLRRHPSEAVDKYAWAFCRYRGVLEPAGTRTLLEEINDATVVAGCESMALVTAVIARRRVLCCIPPGGPPCSLPHSEIEMIRELVSRR